MQNARQWLLALGASLLLHGALLVAWPSLEGARGPGERGVEIGLGLLGDLGDALDPAPEAEPEPEEPEPPPVLEPAPEPPPVNEPEPTPEPVLPPAPTPIIEASAPTSDAPPVASVETPAAVPRPPPPPSAPRQRGQAAGGSSPSAGGNVGLRRSYAGVLAAHLNRYKSYPMSARRQGREGTARLRLVVERTGGVLDARIARSAPFPEFDEAAMSMLARAQPLPPFPNGMSETEIVVMVPVTFELSD